MILIEPISAITSWENYEYQGHLALYMSLKKIEEIIVGGGSLDNIELQIEGEEDFSFRKDGMYISLHQVKAGECSLDEREKFAFVIGSLQHGAEGFFHVTKKRNIQSDFLSSTTRQISLLKNQMKQQVVEAKDLPKGASEDDYIIVNKISANHKKASKYDMLKFVTDNSKNVAIVKKASEDIYDALSDYEDKISNIIDEAKKSNPSVNEEELFVKEYGEKFDNNREIRNASYQIIRNILNRECPNYSVFLDESYEALVYDRLLLALKEGITEHHIDNIKGGKCLFLLSSILEMVKEDYHETINTVQYNYYLILRAIRDCFAEYPQKLWNNCKEENCSGCLSNSTCHLCNQIKLLNESNDEEKKTILHNLLLQHPKRINNIPSDDLIYHLFLNLLDEIKNLGLESNMVFQCVKDTQIYRLSLDSSYTVEDFQVKLAEVLANSDDKSLLYECDTIITDKLSCKGIFYNGANISILSEKELKEIDISMEKIKKDSLKPKILRLVDQNEARRELI